MYLFELFIVLFAIYLGARLGGIAIGFAGGLGVVLLGFLCQVSPGDIPTDVILIIMAVIAAIAAMQIAGGMDYLVYLAEKLLRKHPKHITLLAPLVTYFMTILAGTGHTAFSTLPVIVEVAKSQGIRPSRPLSIAVVASQIAITASPISAAFVVVAAMLDNAYHVSYLMLLFICLSTTLTAVILTSFVCGFLGKELKDDPIYQQRLARGEVTIKQMAEYNITPAAKRSVLIFILGIIAVVCYSIAISNNVQLISHPPLSRDQAILSFMLTTATIIVIFCKVDTAKILSANTFRSGMSACVCVLGVAWLGNTFVSAHIEEIKALSGNILTDHPWMLAIVLFFASMLLYSQAATAKTLLPAAIAMGIPSVTVIAAFPAVSALFVLPTYPTVLAAVEMDDTGSTRIGKYVFDHPFLIPGVIAISLSVLFGFILGGILL